jgi:penicillin-binding protein 1A
MKSSDPASQPPRPSKGDRKHSPKRVILTVLASLAGLAVAGVLVVVFGLAMAYPNLPALDTLTDYRPKMPLRIFTADNVLIGEFGEERRTLVHFKDIPDVMKKAVLSIEDDRFYEHGGIDYWGILRAAGSVARTRRAPKFPHRNFLCGVNLIARI